MIPPYEETIRLIESHFPEWTWLMRNNHTPQGKYFFHLYKDMDQVHEGKSFKCYTDSPDAAAFRVYCDAHSMMH